MAKQHNRKSINSANRSASQKEHDELVYLLLERCWRKQYCVACATVLVGKSDRPILIDNFSYVISAQI